ncbi:MAG: cellulose synthase complex periplasmic endoglucanase BcsZ, partial [Nitrospiraceae bacterium]
LLQWTENNLAGGSLAERAPGWHWGESDTGQWTLLDANPASDADLWMSYALLEAGQRWQHDAYTRLGLGLAEHLLRDASPVLPGLGRSLLPAPKGFQLGPTRWRLNPSYAPLPLLRRLAALTTRSEWLEMLEPTLRLIVESAPHGISPEWAIWDANSGWQPDPETRGLGSYNAIRSYLWTGMSRDDPAFERLALGFLPWLHWVAQHGHAPESLNAQKAPSSQPMPAAGPPGFDGAALLLADSLRFSSLSRHLNKRLEPSLGSKSPGYYSHALLLFGLGWIEGRYRFATDGSLLLPGAPCEPHVD